MSPLSPSNVDSALECASKATSAPTKLVKITYDRAQDIPPELKEIIPGDVFERSQDGRWDLIISMPNDNAGFGLWQLITGTDSGNDFGNTHGTKIQIGTDTNGYYQQGAFETNLYTQQASSFNKNKQGRTKAYQFFTEENILRYLVDNRNKGHVVFYEAGGGVTELNRDDVRGWLFATGQQKTFHKYTADYDFINIPRNGKNQTGIFAESGIGHFSQALFQNGSCRISGEIKVNAIKSTIHNADSLTGSGKTNIYFQSGENSWTYNGRVEVATIFHQTANSPASSVGVGAGAGKGSLAISFDAKKTISGTPQNYVDFNQDTDTTYTIEIIKKLGTPTHKTTFTEPPAKPTRVGGTNFKKESLASNQAQSDLQVMTQKAAVVFGQLPRYENK